MPTLVLSDKRYIFGAFLLFCLYLDNDYFMYSGYKDLSWISDVGKANKSGYEASSEGSPEFSGQHYYSFSSIFYCPVLSWGPSFSELLESVITLNVQESSRNIQRNGKIFFTLWKWLKLEWESFESLWFRFCIFVSITNRMGVNYHFWLQWDISVSTLLLDPGPTLHKYHPVINNCRTAQNQEILKGKSGKSNITIDFEITITSRLAVDCFLWSPQSVICWRTLVIVWSLINYIVDH